MTVNNDSTPDLLFNTDDGSGNITEALRLDSSQNATFANGVSIGDSGAVYGTDNASAGIFLRAANRGVSGEFASGYARNLIRSDGSATIEVGDNTSLISLIKLNAGSSATNGVVSFMTKGSERMRVHHDGTVGIGTNSPGEKLEIYTDGTDVALKIHAKQVCFFWRVSPSPEGPNFGIVVFMDRFGHEQIWTFCQIGHIDPALFLLGELRASLNNQIHQL